MSAEENKALIAQLYDEVFVNWNLAFLDEIIDPEFVSHDMPPGLPKGAEGLRQFYGGLRTAFPDLRIQLKTLSPKMTVWWFGGGGPLLITVSFWIYRRQEKQLH